MLANVPTKAKLVWERLTFSKLTIAYVCFAFIHFALQLALQLRAFTINAEAASLLTSIAVQGNATNSSFPALDGPLIRMCATVPTTLDTDGCQRVYNGTPSTDNGPAEGADPNGIPTGNYYAASLPIVSSTSATSSSTVSSASASASADSTSASATVSASVASQSASASRSVEVIVITQIITTTPTATAAPLSKASNVDNVTVSLRAAPQAKVLADNLNDDRVTVRITGMGWEDYPLDLDRSCMWSLNWPISVLDNTKREDIVFIAFQFWVLGMSMVALLNESMPHIIASLLTHVLATAWSGFQIQHTANFRQQFEQYITLGACNPAPSLLPSYWKQRADGEIPSLALNAAALIVSTILTWKLVKLFGWQTFKRVGASRTINRVYKLVLVFSINMQVSIFFMGATVSLFLDELFNGTVGQLAGHNKLYKGLFMVVAILLVPWITLGWFAVRREMRKTMIVFLGASMLYLAGWGVMFFSTTFRWTFRTWLFFSIISAASVFLTLMAFVLGVACRMNFGKGLRRYLHAQESLGDDDEFTDEKDVEKVAFPSNEPSVRTYSATFGSGSEIPAPLFNKPNPQLGPRFFNSVAQPFDNRSLSSAGASPISPPMAALTRITTKDSFADSVKSGATAVPGRRESGRSLGSPSSYYDYSAGDAAHQRRDSESHGGAKRWVIDDE